MRLGDRYTRTTTAFARSWSTDGRTISTVRVLLYSQRRRGAKGTVGEELIIRVDYDHDDDDDDSSIFLSSSSSSFFSILLLFIQHLFSFFLSLIPSQLLDSLVVLVVNFWGLYKRWKELWKMSAVYCSIWGDGSTINTAALPRFVQTWRIHQRLLPSTWRRSTILPTQFTQFF